MLHLTRLGEPNLCPKPAIADKKTTQLVLVSIRVKAVDDECASSIDRLGASLCPCLQSARKCRLDQSQKGIAGLQSTDNSPATGIMDIPGLLKAFFAAAVVGVMAVTFALSLAAMIYAGPLAPYLSQGIGLTLIGAAVMALMGPLTLSYRGTLVQPQDVSTILLSISAGAIASLPAISAQAAFSTVVALAGLTSIAIGATAYLLGVLKLGYLVRFVPFPVVSGFLAASGVLLVRGAYGMVVTEGDGSLGQLLASWPLWLPWLGVSLVIVTVSRLFSSGLAIPMVLFATLAGFYGITALMGLDFAAMREMGVLLGPFQGGSFIGGLNLGLFRDVQWLEILAQTPVIATIIGVSMLGMLLNASGLELAIEREIDFERELKGVGLANVAAGLVGGLGGYHILSETLLARRFGLVGASAGLGLAATIVIVLFFGAGVLAYLPIGLFAAVVFFLGFDLLLTAYYDHGMVMPRVELAIVVAMPVIALVFGFMVAVGFGVAVAALLFVIAYSRVDSTQISTNGANFHARVERSPDDRARLAEMGECVSVSRLEGFLFFGSASRLVDRLQCRLEGGPAYRYAIVDLQRVVGLDMSAWSAFERLGRSCGQLGIQMIVTGLSPDIAARFGRRKRQGGQHFRLADSLDDVMLEIEESLLRETQSGQSADGSHGLGTDTAELLQKYGTRIDLAAGEQLFFQGNRSDHLIFLLSGRLRATVTDRNHTNRVVSRFLPGAIVGEIAYYAGVDRTATLTAETDSTALRIDTSALALMEREDPQAAAQFHRTLASVLAQRLLTTTRLLSDAEL
jgi:sulfate permease, SulP family